MHTKRPKINNTRVFRAGLLGAALLMVGGGLFLAFRPKTQTAEITTDKISGDKGRGRIVEGDNKSSQSGRLSTDGEVVYESEELDSPKPTANAAVLDWDQQGATGEVLAGFRIYDGQSWSKWVDAPSDQDGKDGAPETHAALVLADRIHKIQYRFELSVADGQELSPEVDLDSASIELVDTTKGPSVGGKKPSKVSKLLDRLGISKTAQAHADEPRIISRAEWGAPEPNSSVRWEPEYRPLSHVIVHHTAAASNGDSAAAVRAVWYFHANSRGWGDIGYNYLVDQSGNVFEGRYYDKDYAERNSVDVVGGHALVHNYGSTGISAIGDFTNEQPTGALLNSISYMAAYKLYRYGVDPGGWQGDYPVIVGHKDVMQTACPGNIHPHLPTIRALTGTEVGHFNSKPFVTSDYEVVKGMNSPAAYLVINNELRPLDGPGHRDCYILAYHGRMRSVSDANIASRNVGADAPTCEPPDYTWYYPEKATQQYVLLYGGMYPVGGGDVAALGGTNRARPLSDAGIQYLHDYYVSPEIPGNILVKGSTQPAVYEADSDELQQVPNPDRRDCLISQLGPVRGVPDSLIADYDDRNKINVGFATCTITKGQILNPDGMTVARVVSGSRRSVANPTVRDCIIVRTDTGMPYKVSQTAWDSFSAGAAAYCPYDSSIRFVKEASDPTVWRVYSDGRKQHADGFCVSDPFTTPLPKYHVWVVPNGETAGHTYDGTWSATQSNCAAVT